MSVDIDFTMTYPCFAPLRPNGVPYTFTADGDCCIAIFTDDDLVTRFAQGGKAGAVGSAKMTTAAQLISILEQCQGSETDQGKVVTHIIIDPTPGRQARVYAIAEFISHIK